VTDKKGKKPIYTDKAAAAISNGTKQKWEAPNEGMIKVNVDGAFGENGDAGFGVIIRDDRGAVILSAWGVIHDAASAEETEFFACREGVKLAARWSPQPAIVESDCLTTVKYLQSPSTQRSLSAFILAETLQAAEGLPSIRFQHVGRDKNRVAHELAQLARMLSHSAVWNIRVPVCVEQIVAQDCNPCFE
jgi:ribonuclease HI